MTADFLWRPLVGPCGPHLAGGWARAREVQNLSTGDIIPIEDLPGAVADRFCRSRVPLLGFDFTRPLIMAILNVTPDSFSDGGRFIDPDAAVAQGLRLVGEGADILDIGGESTRPGAVEVSVAEEIARVVPVIRTLRAAGIDAPISIDTRKAKVAAAALEAGAAMINDVSAMTFDHDMAQVMAEARVPVCLMHAQGTPETMQRAPRYDDVTRDVIAHLAERIDAAVDSGIDPERIIVDPGIGFGKTMDHNLLLMQHLSAFHGLGAPVLLGASRKRFIGVIGGGDAGEVPPSERLPGSLAVALKGVAQGMQILRVHDTKSTKQALNLHMAMRG